jgi:hypothetical protein
MAISKKKKKGFLWFIGLLVLAVIFGKPIATSLRLAGTWNGIPWADIQKQYAGISIGLFSNQVTVSSRPDLSGTLSGDVITWNNGGTWKKG